MLPNAKLVTRALTTLDPMRKGVKVRRVVRRFELWPVAKVAFFFHLLCYLLTLGVLSGVWFVANRMGTIKNLERLITRLGWDEFEVHGDVLFRSAVTIGAAMVLVATIATVTLAFFYNMLSGIFGGLVLSVLQEHTDGSSLSRRQRRRASRARRKAAKHKPRSPTPQPTSAAVPSAQAPTQFPPLRQPSQPAPAPVTDGYLDDADIDDDNTWTDHLRPRETPAVGSSS